MDSWRLQDAHDCYYAAINELRRRHLGVRKEQIGDATLYLGDCLDILPTLGNVDAVVTSPPYNTLVSGKKPSGMHRESNWHTRSHEESYFDEMPEEEYQFWQNKILNECLNVSNGICWFNHKIRFRNGVGIHPARMYHAPIYCEVIWSRPGSVALNNRRFALSHEHLLGFGRPHYWDDKENTKFTVWRINPDIGSDHPVAFPIELITPCVRSSSPFGGIILDPFMGSGTTGVACAKLGRKFIGIEICEDYFNIAVKRITDAYRQGDLFINAEANHKKAEQMSLLREDV